ncbi:MAG: restriction endonuclease subunit S [Candidatus Omnitrophota bacterium]
MGDVVTFQRGYDLPKAKMKEGSIPVAGSNGIIGYHNEFTTRGPGITIGRSGNIGTPKFYKKNFWAHNTVLYIKDFKENYEKFIFYFLHWFDFSGFNSGSAVPTLNRNHIQEIPVIVPPPSEQRAIAEVLSSLDDKIDFLHWQNQTFEKMAEALWRKIFVEDADPSWKRGKLGDYITVKGGTTPCTTDPNLWDGNIPWTSPRDLSGSNKLFLHETERKITEKGLSQIGSGLLPIGTVLLSSRAPIGYLAISNIPVAINQGYIAIICDSFFSNYYMYFWIKANMELIIGSANGSTFLEISKSVFKDLETEIPSESAINKFNSSVKNILYKILTNEIQIRTLTRMRDTLLPKLMNGEIRVKL